MLKELIDEPGAYKVFEGSRDTIGIWKIFSLFGLKVSF